MKDIHPIQAFMAAMSDQWRAERERTQMTLGKLLDALYTMDPMMGIQISGEPHSYRGYYEDLAFEPTVVVYTIATIISRIEKTCMGQVFHGYKGGEFAMHRNTPLWIANYGSTGQKLLGLDTESEIYVIPILAPPGEY
jgi:hypothetical protein